MPQNIEIKLRHEPLDEVEVRALEHGANRVGVLIQRDTFFNCGQGRLKLREIADGHAELIAYSRSDAASARSSDYTLVHITEPAQLIAALSRSIGVRGVVAKHRTLLLWRNVRIHLDRVDGLGQFVELESVVGEVDHDTATANLDACLDLLRLRDAEIVPVAYMDLLEQ